MNKAEKAAFEALRIRAALSWPAPPPAPVSAEEIGAQRTFRGWWAIPARGAHGVGEGVVVGPYHAREPYTDDEVENRYTGNSRVSLSQGRGGPWYRTKLDATRALHYAVAVECAERLAQIERRIEEIVAE